MVVTVRTLSTEELSTAEQNGLRTLFEAAWSDDPEAFTEEDWDHAMGGVHLLVEADGRIVSHAAVVERELHAGHHRLPTGYVEAMATLPGYQGRGLGTVVMTEVNRYIDERFPLGGLDTGVHGFYERLGWELWKGPTFVRMPWGVVRTPEDDGAVMIRRTPTSPPVDLTAALSCEWRQGDVW